MTALLTTDEILKPDIVDMPTSKCHWWSARHHCWHLFSEPRDGTDIMRRRCCWCAETQRTCLQAVGHGAYIPDKQDQTLIWTPWRHYW